MELTTIKVVEFGESEGGLTSESFPMGRYIKDNNIVTVIEDGAICSSSCAMVWVAGTDKEIRGTGVAQFHAPYVPTENIVELIDRKCTEEFLEEDETVDTCEPFTDANIIDGVRGMTRRAIEGGVSYMMEVGAPNELTLGMIGEDPSTFISITNKNMNGGEINVKLHEL